MYEQLKTRLTALRAYLALMREKIVDKAIWYLTCTVVVVMSALFNLSAGGSMNPLWFLLTPAVIGVLGAEAYHEIMSARCNRVRPEASELELQIIKAMILWIFIAMGINGATLHPALWLMPLALGYFFARPRYMPCAMDKNKY